ncbi:MAG: PHP domain-containing protein [Clostridia bacterium]|nr:PHP domain-containing protein [Clostridia bacterium]
MKTTFISQDQPQYRANLHSHSNLSDGKLSPKELADIYRQNGYSILAITDHEYPKSHSELSREDFLLLTGYEAYIRTHTDARFDAYAPEVHLNLFAKEQDNETMICFNEAYCKYLTDPVQRKNLRRVGSERPREYSTSYVNEFIESANRAGYLVSYNHPVWSMEDEERIFSYEGLFSLEMDNTGTNRSNGMEYSGHLYDKLLLRRKHLFCHSGDDNHNKNPLTCPRSDSFGSFTMILANSLTYPDIIRAMETGSMYASTGPLIHEISVCDGRIHIECSPAAQIICSKGTRVSPRIRAIKGDSLTCADFSLDPIAPYFRVVVVDEQGHRATSRGYFREEYS